MKYKVWHFHTYVNEGSCFKICMNACCQGLFVHFFCMFMNFFCASNTNEVLERNHCYCSSKLQRLFLVLTFFLFLACWVKTNSARPIDISCMEFFIYILPSDWQTRLAVLAALTMFEFCQEWPLFPEQRSSNQHVILLYHLLVICLYFGPNKLLWFS